MTDDKRLVGTHWSYTYDILPSWSAILPSSTRVMVGKLPLMMVSESQLEL
jgi:hypothetical protein